MHLDRAKVKQLAFLSAVGLTLVAVFTLLNPKNLPLAFLILPFVLFFCLLFMSASMLLPKRWQLQHRKQRTIIAGVIAVLPVLLLVFQSIHQLTIRDILVSISLVVLGVFYVSRADFIR